MTNLPPKSMKDPVRIAGEWEERVPAPVTAGTTSVDVKTLNVKDRDNREHKEALEGMKFVPQAKKK